MDEWHRFCTADLQNIISSVGGFSRVKVVEVMEFESQAMKHAGCIQAVGQADGAQA